VTRRQVIITASAVVGALILGVVVTLLATSGDDPNEISTVGTQPTLPPAGSTLPPLTSPPAPQAPATTAPTVAPTTPPPSVIINPPPPTGAQTTPPTNPPSNRPTNAPTNPPTNPPTTKPTTPTTAPPPTDPGITATEIRLAVIADSPDSVAGMNAWAATVNAKKAGLGGREIVIDPFVVNGDAGAYTAAVKTACTQDFAIVGTLSTADANVADLQACNIPDLPTRALSSGHRAAENTYAVVPTSSTQELVGGFKWLLQNVQGCCKQYVISSTNPAAAAATQQSVDAANNVGFTAAGGTALAANAPPSAYAAVVDEMEAKGATFGRSDLPFSSTINLRTEAQTQNFTGVKAWFCLAQCYAPTFLSQGGATVEGQFVQITSNPFEDASSIPSMKRYLAAGGPQSLLGLESYSAGLLFESAAKSVLAAEGKNGLTRVALLQVVAETDDFDAGGILGSTNVGARTPNGCFVMLKVQGGKFVRAEPAGKAQLNCGSENLVTIGP
jgi:hypothetical protein